ncbi:MULTISPECIES: M56 family metallopeptidase [Thermomonosporaceae]|uniref:M56 family metallopeptidase n=1 Tax=Thermomonosporaceae TaxID=2012 RepID=UPI00255A7E29|nr:MULTISPECIES: M56 family metallopeptidase [Thermomonosporaceae]MDL4772787.1 M56 family metallopeptidase [Actinomadura xylanilytica]
MTGTALLALISLGTIGGAHLLSKARWTWRTPRTGIVLWQSLGLGWGIATIGTLLGLALLPYRKGIAGGLPGLLGDQAGRLDAAHMAALLAAVSLTAVLLAMLMYAVVRVVRARHRHRALLALVSRHDSAVPGTLVLDHPAAAAYCVPGVRSSKVVVSAGTLELLDSAELAAVLAHERAHARERHDLVLLPFASLRQVFPQFRLVGRCLDAVELLIEMAADDRARRNRPPRELATALLRFAAARPAAAPSGTLGVASRDDIPVMARVNRLLEPKPVRRSTRFAAIVAVPVIAGLPVLLYALPH